MVVWILSAKQVSCLRAAKGQFHFFNKHELQNSVSSVINFIVRLVERRTGNANVMG